MLVHGHNRSLLIIRAWSLVNIDWMHSLFCWGCELNYICKGIICVITILSKCWLNHIFCGWVTQREVAFIVNGADGLKMQDSDKWLCVYSQWSGGGPSSAVTHNRTHTQRETREIMKKRDRYNWLSGWRPEDYGCNYTSKVVKYVHICKNYTVSLI